MKLILILSILLLSSCTLKFHTGSDPAPQDFYTDEETSMDSAPEQNLFALSNMTELKMNRELVRLRLELGNLKKSYENFKKQLDDLKNRQ